MSIRKRLKSLLVIAITSFIIITFINKLLLKSNSWLFLSVQWTICYILGIVTSWFTEKLNFIQKLLFIIVAILAWITISTFMTSDVLNYKELATYNWIPFGISLIVNSMNPVD